MADGPRKTASDVIDHALEFAARGWAVIPAHQSPLGGGCSCSKGGDCPSPGKHPRAKRGIYEATTDPKEIRRRFRRDDNIIIAMGRVSGLFALDIDGTAGIEAVRQQLQDLGLEGLPATVTARTGGGGWHYLFRLPAEVQMPNRVGLVKHVDIRGDGGGIVAPPSVHESGRRYVWAPGRSPGEIEVAEAPQWLLDRIFAPQPERQPLARPAARDGMQTYEQTYAQRALDAEAIRVLNAEQGTRHNTLFAAAAAIGELVGTGALGHEEAAAALTRAALGAGLQPAEVDSTVRDGLVRGRAQPRDLSGIGTPGSRDRRPPNPEALNRRCKALKDDAGALAWVAKCGFDERTVEMFLLGLSSQEPPLQGQARRRRPLYRRALSTPLRRQNGPVNRFVHMAMPGVTTHPPAATWATGDPETYWCAPDASQPIVIVALMLDVFALWQLLRDAPLGPQVQIVASSREGVPAEWSTVAFWDRWNSVYVATPRGDDDIATLIMRSAAKPVLRLLPPSKAGTWLDHLGGAGTSQDLEAALHAAREVEEELSGSDDPSAMGRLAYQPVDIGRAFHRGNLYYPTRTLMREKHLADDGSAQVVESVETVVVRSDGKILTAREMPAKPGTPLEARVWRLSDGTLIDEPPAPARQSSWRWTSIEAWLQDCREGRRTSRALAELVRELRDVLDRTIWLPHHEDLTTLAFLVATSYVQAVFRAIPYALVSGEKGSGKSQLGIALAQLSCNGFLIGQTSAASAARAMHEGRGLTVFDDLEGIGSKRGADAAFTELVQWLKVSYNAATAKKVWTDSANGFRVRTLNGFGIKVINNTLGTDGILGSRMIRVPTRRIPPTVAQEREQLEPASPAEMQRLRDELHIWAFENVQTVDTRYRAMVAPAERDAEIAAPLRVLSSIAGDDELAMELEVTLARSRSIATSEAQEPSDIIRVAAEAIVRQGFYTLSPLCVAMEARRIVGPTHGRKHAQELTEIDDTASVGRILRSLDIIAADAHADRQRLFGMQLRFYPVSSRFLDEVFEGEPRPESRGAKDWCSTYCETCPYAVLDCPLMQRRQQEQASRRRERFTTVS